MHTTTLKFLFLFGMLAVEPSELSPLSGLFEKLTIIGVLGYFLYYFMRELRDIRTKHEIDRKLQDDKIEKLTERVLMGEGKYQELTSHTNTVLERLTDVIEDLSSKIKAS